MAEPPRKTLDDLIAIMAALRTPVTGCPWDLEQSFETIAPYTIEEAYEVADAIERGDLADLEEELGDLLLQVVYHARLAEEEGAFTFADVAHGVASKMIRRHPHVFGDAEARSAGMAKDAWERIKSVEKAEKAQRKAARAGRQGTAQVADAASATPSLLDAVPIGLPGLTRAVKLQDAAARVGFDWPSVAPVFTKVREELAELEAAARRLDPRGPEAGRATAIDKDAVTEELGDLLFVIANIARHLAIDPETALRRANAKFVRRFRHIETALAARGSSPAKSNLAEMDALWNEAKADERAARSGGLDKSEDPA